MEKEKMNRYYYPAVFTYEDGQEIAVVFPDLGVATNGINEQDALASGRELLGCVINGLEEDNEPIPQASRLSDIEVENNERVVLIDVYMPAVRKANQHKSVSRTVTLPASLNAIALEHNVNFSQVLQDALKELLLKA